MKKQIPAGIARMRNETEHSSKENDFKLSANSMRKWILRDVLKGCTSVSVARKRYKDVNDGKYDDLVDSYLDELEVLIKAKIKERNYWRI